MTDHAELLKDAREMAKKIASGEHYRIYCVTDAAKLRTLADIVEAQDKAESEAIAACILCGQNRAHEWEWLVGPPAGRPGEISIPRTVYLCNHCVTVMKVGRPPVHRKGDAETQMPVDMTEVFAELLAACRTCEEIIGALINSARPVSVDGTLDAELPVKWERLRAGRHLAKLAVENADKVKGGE